MVKFKKMIGEITILSKNKTVGMICALLANLIFGFSFIFSKTALQIAHPLVILSVRFAVAFLTLNLLLLTKKFKINLKGKSKTKLIMMSIAQPLLYFIFELYGLSLVSSALSGVIIALVPVAVMLLAAVFLKEKSTLLQKLCTILSIAAISAISVISNNGKKSYFLGIILLVLAVLSAAVFNILSRSESKKFTAFERTYIMFLCGALGFNLIAVCVLKGQYFTQICTAFQSINFIISIIYLAVISSVLAFLLYNFSTSKIPAVQSSSFSNIITVVTVIAGVLILKESFNIWQFLLCGIIILGVFGVNTFTPKKE